MPYFNTHAFICGPEPAHRHRRATGLAEMVDSLRTMITVAIVLAAVVPKLLPMIDSFFDLPSANEKMK
jgi:hypothetical protein